MRVMKSVIWAIWMVCLAFTFLYICRGNTQAKEYTPDIPIGTISYTSTTVTQSISVLDERDNIVPVSIRNLEDKRWHQPGGLDGVDPTSYRSDKYRYVPNQSRIRTWIGNIGVRNSLGYIQQNRGIIRDYPTGTRFDEVLINTETGKIFEQRTRQKGNDGWQSTITFKDETSRPHGYTGLKVSCSSCHNEAGTGGYAVGLVPGGDTVLSDPLDWSLVSSISTPAPTGWVQPTAPQPMPMKVDPKAPVPTPKMVTPVPTTYVEVRSGLRGRRVTYVPVLGATATSFTTTRTIVKTTTATTSNSCTTAPAVRGRFRTGGCN